MTSNASEPFALADQAAAELARITGATKHDVVVILGSGWREAANELGSRSGLPVGIEPPDGARSEAKLGPVRSEMGDGIEFPMTDLPGFPEPSAQGHGGTIRSVCVGSQRVLLMLGRVHLYEGHAPATVVHPIRVAAAAGATVAVLTNGAGSLCAEWPVGQAVLVSDHLNFSGHSPMTGPNPPAPHASRFVPLTNAYSPRLRALARSVDPTLPEGVYVGLHGPHFETPAEIAAFGRMGADLVGMSTVLETIAARHVGLEVLCLSLNTNLAAGISDSIPNADDVIEAGRLNSSRMGSLLRSIIEKF
jgi:purine-nucleoside phosphorylase